MRSLVIASFFATTALTVAGNAAQAPSPPWQITLASETIMLPAPGQLSATELTSSQSQPAATLPSAEATVRLQDMQTITQLGAGLAFIFIGIVPFLLQHVRSLIENADMNIVRLQTWAECDTPLGGLLSEKEVADIARRIAKHRIQLLRVERALDSHWSLIWVLVLFVLPGLACIVTLIWYPFDPERRFYGFSGYVFVILFGLSWIPGGLRLMWNIVSVTVHKSAMETSVAELDRAGQSPTSRTGH